MQKHDAAWIAARDGQDLRDEEILRGIDWLTSVVDSSDWTRRMDSVAKTFDEGRRAWANGQRAPLFSPKDTIGWYIFQANALANRTPDWFEPEAFRITPVIARLGMLVPDLSDVAGVMDRVHALMTDGKGQPDDGLFELLVAGAYRQRSWRNVAFVAERPGIAKTQDLLVSTNRRRWAVECKRVNRSGYEADELRYGEMLASKVHDLCRARGRSVILEVFIKVELSKLDVHYLAARADDFLVDRNAGRWDDEYSLGLVRDVDWRLSRTVLQHDDVFFGSSRMVELLVGRYAADRDHSVAADWTPAPNRPLYATAISQASVVSWISGSFAAAKRKARHFRSLVARAAEQLPGDCPGVIHVGYEARDGNSVDQRRHLLNILEMKRFEPGDSRLRWVYGNYMSPEHTNAPNESMALSETTAAYRIGRQKTAEPLPGHVLFDSESGLPGNHWRK